MYVKETFPEHIKYVQDTPENRERLGEKYWDKVDGKDAPKTQKDRLEGLAFSMLVILDGGAMDLPGFIVAPDPHPSDKEYHISEGSNYFPENHKLDVKGDIAGCLHEML